MVESMRAEFEKVWDDIGNPSLPKSIAFAFFVTGSRIGLECASAIASRLDQAPEAGWVYLHRKRESETESIDGRHLVVGFQHQAYGHQGEHGARLSA